MNRKIFAVIGMSLAFCLASARAAENAGGNAETGKPTDREIRGAIRTFEQQRDRFLNTQRELTREAASATAERRAQIREELNRAKQELEKIRREARESAQNAREQAREQGRRVSDAVREQTGGGRDR